MHLIRNHHLKQWGESLPAVFAMVFYHDHKPYDGCRTGAQIMRQDLGFSQQILCRPFPLIDTHHIHDEAFYRKAWVGPMTFAFKHIFEPDIWLFFKRRLYCWKRCPTNLNKKMRLGLLFLWKS